MRISSRALTKAASGSWACTQEQCSLMLTIFQEIGVEAVFSQQAPKGGLVELGGAGRHHHPVQSELMNILNYIPLTRLGAGVEMIPAHRHPRQTPGLLRQNHRTDDPGDVVAAVANIRGQYAGFRS